MKNPIQFLCSAIGGLLLSDAALAHPLTFNSTLTYSAAQPSGAADSVAQWSGAAFDAANIGGSGVNADGGANNGTANDASTYVTGQPAKGQTFTTGSNANGYDVSSITVRVVGYTNNTASGANLTSWNLAARNGPIMVTFGKVNGTTHSLLSIQNFIAGGEGNPGIGTSVNGPGTHLTFNLPFPVHLDPNTTYSFDLAIGEGSSNHFELLGTSGDPYAGGTAYTRSGSTITPLSGDRVFQVNMTASATPYAPFVHPGALHTQSDFDRMKAKIAAGTAPWKTSYDQFTGSRFAQTAWGPTSVQYINRGGPDHNNYTRTQMDGQAIYQLSLRWKLTGDVAYANQAVVMANSWSGKLLGITGDSNQSLASGICGYLFATGGEILSTYSGWPEAQKQAYKDMMMRVFYPKNFDFLWRHHATPINKGGNTHYRLNWDTDNMASMAAIGILCDNRAVYQQAVDYFKFGSGNGRVERAAWYIHPDGTAQTEESGRDQPHNQGGWYAMGLLCQMAWNQGDDLFGYDNNRALRAYEYSAKYNSGNNDVSWVYHSNTVTANNETLSSSGRSVWNYPAWELVYNHYANVKGIAAPWSKIAMNLVRPEWFPTLTSHPSAQDTLGLGSLTYARDDISTGAAPSGLLAQWSKNQLILNWWGSATATSYQIQRTASGASAAGPYTTLGTAVEPNLNFTDTTVAQGGSYYYKVVAITPTGDLESAPLLANQALVASYSFEGNTNDGTGTRHATAKGGAIAAGYAAGYAAGFGGGQAISLNGVDQYVQLPVNSGLSRDVTLSAWVYWNGGGNAWQRVFDFGSEIEKFMMITVNGGGKIKFQMTTSRGLNGTITLDGPAMPTATWTHLAVTFNGETATLYVNGLPVAAGSSPRLAPMFSQTFCYLGRSMYNSDPYFSGRIDDFRISNYALTGKEIYTLWGQGGANAAPVLSANPIMPVDATQDINYSGSAQTLAGTDANGGTLTYAKITGPAWLTVASNGALSGTPANSDAGANRFVVRVADSSGATDDASLYITVANVNDAPTWNAPALTKLPVTQNVAYVGTLANDADDLDIPYGDTITFSKAGGPAWLVVAADGTLSGTPAPGDVGVNDFVVRVTDSSGAFNDATLTISVLAPALQTRFLLDGSSADSLAATTATLTGAASYGPGVIDQALILDGATNYLTLGTLSGIAYNNFTVATWVYWNGGNAFQRIFDFGSGTDENIYLTASNGSNMRFVIGENGVNQYLDTAPLPMNQWVHVAVTLNGSTVTIYVNGVAKASSASITNQPKNISLTQNYIGKSQYATDPLFSGRIDDFRLYNYALNVSEVSALLSSVPAITPTGLAAVPGSSKITLSWSTSANAQSYSVKRGTTSGGPYTTIGSGLTATTYSDTTGLTNGVTYYYVVSATNSFGESANSVEDAVVLSDLVAHLKFDETAGTAAADSSGNGFDAALVNSPAWATGFLGNAVNLPASASQHLTLPDGIVSGLADFTISTWIKVNAFATWQRIFDFGSGTATNNYMFLTTQYTTDAPNAAKLRFGIRTPTINQQSLNSTNIALTTGAWTHVAVTRSGNTVTLYVNGAVAGSGTITINPSALGATTQNYLGRSQFSADPYLNSALDDFRIYNRALTVGEISTLGQPAAGAPMGLAAVADDGQATLTWFPNATTSYTVKRGTMSGGPYTTLATGLTATTYTDTGLTNGVTYYYVVSGTGPNGSSPDSAEVSAIPNTLRVHLKFDETGGSLATDSSGHTRDGTLVNSPTFAAGKFDNALTLASSSTQHVTLPASSVQGLTAVTIMAWVKPATVTTFSRVFDFGTSTVPSATAGAYMFLTPSTGSVLRFAITTSGYNNDQKISATAPLAAGVWSHVAVTLNGSVGRLYLNGTQVGINSSMTLTPAALGTLTNLYLGKSQFAADPYLNGALDDFRIYGQALSATEIAAYSEPLAAPQNVTATPGLSQIALSWDAVSGASGYTIRRANGSSGPYTDLALEIPATSYTDSGLSSGATWYYTVSARGLAGDGLASDSVAATTYTAVESWRYANFGTTSNSGDAADSADTDSDGMTNAQEYAAGTNPNSAASVLRIDTVAASADDIVVSFPSVSGKTYRLERSATMQSGSWTIVQGNIAGTGSTMQVTDVGGAAQSKRFYRIVTP